MTMYRLIRVTLSAVALVLLLVLLSAATYEHVGAWRDGRMLTQVGRSIDIGGRSLNIHCTGEGSPTVVLVSARTAPGYVWTPAQRGISEFARACWYDRADLGWSEPGPGPVTGETAARELHQLLDSAGIERPLILVGHSFGGYVIRLYHHAYPGEVAGMVLVDAAHEDAGTIHGIPHRDPPRIPRSMIAGLSMLMGRLGMNRYLAADPGPPPIHWKADEWEVLARLRRQRNVLLADGKMASEYVTADLVRGAGGLEDLPLIVLTQGRAIPDPTSVEAGVRRGWIDLQRSLAERSRQGRHVLVANSGHGIPVEAPDAVIAAVRELVGSRQ